MKELGVCPFCQSKEYVRDNVSLEDDFVRAKCICKCGKEFVEYFGLDGVYVNKDVGEVYYTTTLNQEAKNLIIEWCNEAIKDEALSERFIAKRIKKIMKGECVKEND